VLTIKYFVFGGKKNGRSKTLPSGDCNLDYLSGKTIAIVVMLTGSCSRLNLMESGCNVIIVFMRQQILGKSEEQL
jgi:ketol-acid reductoisomerase